MFSGFGTKVFRIPSVCLKHDACVRVRFNNFSVLKTYLSVIGSALM
jgi:hypothetical protein